MSVLVSILTFLNGRMETPTNYGIWHICFLLLTIGATVLMTVLFRNASDRTMRRVLTVMWVIFLVFEVYKHIVFSFSVEDGRIVFDYPWYIFPFQFCSTPFYALPFLIFLKDGPVRDFFAMFTTGFVLFAGLAVMLYPNDVFTTRTGVNIQTMVHHGMQVVMGVMLVAYNRRRMTLRNLGGGIASTGGYIAGDSSLIAMIADRLTAPGIGKQQGANFNLNNSFFKGIFMAPNAVKQALKTAVYSSYMLEKLGYNNVSPKYDEYRSDIIQTVELGDKGSLVLFTQGLQESSPIDSFVKVVPAPMPGYPFDEVMACGAFTQGSTIELSGDAPVIPPYTLYMQGGLSHEYGKLSIMLALSKIRKKNG